MFDLEKLSGRIGEIELEMSSPGFWNNPDNANKLIEEMKFIKIDYEPIETAIENIEEVTELASIVEESDEKSIAHLKKSIKDIEKQLADIEFRKMMSEPDDRKDAIISINSGAGGTESCDWASMLLRMYKRWAESHGFKTQIIDHLDGEEAGIKNVTMIVKGDFVFGKLKAEEGVHRLVRISPFDSNKRRHTSFASVDVIPEIEEEVDIKIEEKDLKIDVYRSSGKGGQGVNTTDSAVRITHLPTGIVVTCQDERSQFKNKSTAMKVLKARIYARQKAELAKQMEADYKQKQDIAWGSQIRSYVMHPYSMVKDHRTDYETGNVAAVMDGELDAFIEAYLKWRLIK